MTESEKKTLDKKLSALMETHQLTMGGSPQLIDGLVALGSVSLLEKLLVQVPNGERLGRVDIFLLLFVLLCVLFFSPAACVYR